MRLIDADALKKAMDGYWGRCQRIRKPRNGETAVFLDIKAIVETQPTIDAVPVIRCKDCKRYREYTYLGTQKVYVCERDYRKRIYDMKEDDFCSKAERKEHETD